MVSIDIFTFKSEKSTGTGISIPCQASAFHKCCLCKESLAGSNVGSVTAALAYRAFENKWIEPYCRPQVVRVDEDGALVGDDFA